MQLTALVDGPDHVCCRYRLAAFRPHLARAGHSLELRTLPRRWWQRWQLFRELCGATVVLQRHLLPGWQLALLRCSVRRLLFDFDDAVFLRDSYSPKGLKNPRRRRRFAATVRACDAIVAGNDFLRGQAERWAGPGRVRVIPTCIDLSRYAPAPGWAGSGMQMVWVGSASTLRGLRLIAPLLEELGRRIPGLSLKIVCDTFLELRDLPVVTCPWSEAGEGGYIASADVGISWIPDDLWSRGKCGLKVLQYLAAGLPVVANPVGVHPEMVQPGVNGFLPSTDEEWLTAMTRLAEDVELRRRMGEAGRRLVEAEYGIAVGAERWLRLLDALDRPQARSA